MKVIEYIRVILYISMSMWFNVCVIILANKFAYIFYTLLAR